MKYFTMSQFATALDATARGMPKRIGLKLYELAEFIQKEAQGYIGHPQDDWDSLAQSTIALKNRSGYGSKGPLDRTGEMRQSITFRVYPFEAIVESFNRALYFHETGTIYMPKRPVLSRAVMRNEKMIALILGRAVNPLFGKYKMWWV
jgi:hypothetical protein